jgi:hypothetical protein
MPDWVLIPCLKALFAEFDRIAPSRDHASDGSVGDTAHQEEVSDHNPDETGSVPIHDADKINEVHAIDVDNTLNESDLTMEKVVQHLLARCRSGAEKRLRYMIYNRRIWSASSGWVQKTYTGASPHTEHAHFSASYETNLESSTVSWHLEDIPVALTAADKTWISTEIAKQVKANSLQLSTVVGNKVTPARNVGQVLGDLGNQLRPAFVFPRTDKENVGSGMPTSAPIWALLAMPDRLTAIEQKLATLTGGK